MMNIQNLFQEPETFYNHKVLKNGSALVLRLDTEDGPVVCKIAHANNAILEREAARIQQLKSRYPGLGERLPAILGQGVIGSGLHRDKTFYLQEFIEGETLACRLQKEGAERGQNIHVLRSIASDLLDFNEEHDFDKGQDRRSGHWMRDYIGEANHRLLGLEHIGYLASQDEIVINGKPRISLSRCLERIYRSNVFGQLNQMTSSISVLGHWNFHAENILLTDRDGSFRVIDPDAKIDVSDPMFGLARLLYSFPHDTAENRQYLIETDVLVPNEPQSNQFDVHFKWPESVIENYAPLYAGMTGKGAYAPAFLDDRLAEPVMAARLDLCFLLCLLRGVAINHDTDFRVMDDSLRTFQNKGVFLFLTATDFANVIVERFDDFE